MKTSRLFFCMLGFASSLLTACGGSPPPAPIIPPEATSAFAVQTTIPQIRSIISVKIDEIRIREQAKTQRIPVDTVWMIPVNTTRQVSSRMQYLETDKQIIVENGKPYKPTSPWFISVERDDLNQENFGIWFVISHTSDKSLITRDEFNSLLQNGAEVVIGSALGAGLVMVSPGIPDELLPAGLVASGGQGVLARTSVMGRRFIDNLIGTSANAAVSLTEAQVDSLFGAAKAVDNLSYFGEAYVILPASDNYYLNNQITAVTADGSLEVVFSVFETDNLEEAAAQTLTPVDIAAYKPCNAQLESTLFSGSSAKVMPSQVNVYTGVYNQTIAFRLRGNDVVSTVFPYCDTVNGVLWWRIRTEDGQLGWTPESIDTRLFLERADE